MLMTSEEGTVNRPAAMSMGRPHVASEEARQGAESSARRRRLARAVRVEWLGQMIASICWIASVFAYGVSSSGDSLQLCAASAWLLANIASLLTSEAG